MRRGLEGWAPPTARPGRRAMGAMPTLREEAPDRLTLHHSAFRPVEMASSRPGAESGKSFVRPVPPPHHIG